jgi:gliding motility-associated-like protein
MINPVLYRLQLQDNNKPFILKYIIVILVTLGCLQIIHAQSSEGYSFWLSFMEHIDAGNNQKVAMITAKNHSTGFVDIVHHDWRYPFNISENNVTLFYLPTFIEVLGTETVGDLGIQLTSREPFSVYIHQYSTNRSEATSILPESALGKAYYAIAYRGSAVGQSTYPSEFLILSTQDETTVEITPSERTRAGRPADSTFSIMLNMGETYQVQAKYSNADLTGSYIAGDKNFALFAGASTTGVPAGCLYRDNLLEQMFPIDMWGKEYVTVPNINVDFDVFRILASEDQTQVEVHGALINSYILNAGEFVEYLESIATYIKSNKAIQVAQYNVSTECSGYEYGDPSMLLLNSVSQTRDTVSLYSSPFQEIRENFINITMLAEDAPYVLIDGQKLEDKTNIYTIGPNDKYAYARVKVIPGVHTIFSEGCGVIATAYGYGHLESYAYSGGSSFRKINSDFLPDGNCLGDSAHFDGILQEPRFSFYWDLGDGTTSDLKAFSHMYSELGTYQLELRIFDNCLEVWDTIRKEYQVTLRQAVDVGDDVQVCIGDSIRLWASDVDSRATYQWNGPAEFYAESQFPLLYQADESMEGQYTVIGLVHACATYPAHQYIKVNPLPAPDLGPDRSFCVHLGDHILDPGDFTSYQWQDFSTQQTIAASEDGNYWVTVKDSNGCRGTDSVALTQKCPIRIYMPNVFSPNNDGVNDRFGPLGDKLVKVHLQIFDRWGALLFETENPDDHWDGRFDDKDVDTGIYIWKLEYDKNQGIGSLDRQLISGTVMLLR